MVGGFCIVRSEEKGKKDTITVITQQRFFELRFDSEKEASSWKFAMNLVLSNQVRVDKYKKRE